MASRNGSVTRVLISIAFIALGLGFALDAVSNLLDMDLKMGEMNVRNIQKLFLRNLQMMLHFHLFSASFQLHQFYIDTHRFR